MTRLPLDFIVFYVSDLASSAAYFTEKLGFTALPVEENDPPTFRGLSNGQEGLGIGLMQVTEAYQPRPGTVELYFRTPELAALHATLAAGVLKRRLLCRCRSAPSSRCIRRMTRR